MTKILQGIVRGKTIELDTDPGIEEGRAVEIVVRPKQPPGPPPGWKPDNAETAAGMLAHTWSDEDDRILAEIYRDRQQSSRPEIAE
jgi:hypothetical protein